MNFSVNTFTYNIAAADSGAFMGTETELVLKSRRVVPGRLLEDGFRFRFPDWRDAARDLCRRWKALRSRRSANPIDSGYCRR